MTQKIQANFCPVCGDEIPQDELYCSEEHSYAFIEKMFKWYEWIPGEFDRG